ncbi:MAG: class I SAM-dependent methyltransferase [Burkholderiaceae bacterium]
MRIKPYHPVVLDLIQQQRARRVLDAPCGTGWLGHALQATSPQVALDGLGLYEFPDAAAGYDEVVEHDLNLPAPDLNAPYDAVVCGEAIHLIANPGTMLESFKRLLSPGGTLVITTPNSWPPGSRLRYLFRGFHAGFAPSSDRRIGEDYITYFPFHFGQLHLLLRHYGYTDITLHDVKEPKPVRWYERLLAAPSRRYCKRQHLAAVTDMGKGYWHHAGSDASLLGRWLVVSARSPQAEQLN